MTWGERILLAETALALAIASVTIRVLPFRKVVGGLSAPAAGLPRDRGADLQAIARIGPAIEVCARLLPWRIVCFQKGLGMYWMLYRRGVPCLLHYGVAQGDERGLRAHVWLTYEGEGIIGAEQAAEFACLATFPASGSVPQVAGPGAAARFPNR